MAETEECETCPNCRRDIPRQSYMMHSLHCARNIALCPKCDEPVPRAELEQHNRQLHASMECSLCGKQVEACKMEDHQKSECPKRTTLCKYCATHVEMGSLVEHENYCGSRTENCEKCGDFIMLKNFEAHTCLGSMATPAYSAYVSKFGSSSVAETASVSSVSSSSYRSNYSSNQESYSSRRYSTTRSSSITRSASSSIVNNSSLTRPSPVQPSPSSEADSVMLPCEFCSKPIPSFKLLSHQAECVNPSNVRNPSSITSSITSSSRYSRASSITRSYSLTSATSSSRVNKKCEVEPEPKPKAESSSGSGTVSRKVSPTSNSSSIVSKFLSSPAERSNGSDYSSHSTRNLPDSPPRREKDYSGSSYVGRSSYLVEESRRERQEVKKSDSKASVSLAPGLYENDNDREGLRQMLSSLRRDPMDVEDDPDNNDGSFFPCEFCGDPYPCEFLMRHQISCDLNPQPVASGQGFDYSAIKRNIGDHLGVPEPSYSRRKLSTAPADTAEEISRETRRMSRSNSVVDRSYGRSNIRASSVSRTSSFADRSYGTRTNLARQSSFTMSDYSNAARRSSIFDGVAGYSIYSSISDGLDQLSHGGHARMSRRSSVTETQHSANYSLSRQGSFSTRSSVPVSALMASLEANRASKDENTLVANAHINNQASAYLQNGHHTQNGLSRQSSRNETVDSPFGATNGTQSSTEIQRSDSKVMRRRSSLKHSESNYKLGKNVSFHHREQIIGDSARLDENGVPVEGEKKDKKKRTKEEKEARKKEKEEKKVRKEAKRAAREQSVTRGSQSGEALLEQVSRKLVSYQAAQPCEPSQASSGGLEWESCNTANVSTTNCHQSGAPAMPANNNECKLQLTDKPPDTTRDRPRKGPAPAPPVEPATVEDLVKLEDSSVSFLREGRDRSESKNCSKRNSLDNKSVACLAKDLAAECAKAYELMESSLSKLTNDFSIGPFGLTPKTKKKYRGPPAPPLK